MTPHTLCIIEPPEDCMACEREWLGGIVATTVRLHRPGFWVLAPLPTVFYGGPVEFADGKQEPEGGTFTVAINEQWLRPIGVGETAQVVAKGVAA